MKLSRTIVAGLVAAGAIVPITLTVSAGAEDVTANQDPGTLVGDFYVNPDSNAYRWLENNQGNPNSDTIRTELAEQATANWYGDWDNTPLDQYVAAAQAAGQVPIVVAYNMYQRDCNGQSAGGADTVGEYKLWIDDFAADLGDSDAIVVVEPDAVAQLLSGCVPDPGARVELLAYAVNALSSAPNASVYLDAGNAEWPTSPTQVAEALSDAGIGDIRGFAMNVSNHYTTQDSINRAAQINAALPNPAHFVVDSSRNGSGKTQSGPDSWCNPVGATIGEHSTYSDGPADAHLWLKVPGDSDGDCGYGSGTPAGQFTERLAMALITGDYV